MSQTNFLFVRKNRPQEISKAPARVQLAPEAILEVVKKTGVVFFEWNLSQGLSYLSESAQDLLGYSAADFMADPALVGRVVQPAFRRQLTQFWAELQATRPPFARIEIPFVSARGEEVWLEARVVPQYGEDGRLKGVLGIALNATELVASRQAAEEGRSRYRLIFEGAPIPMMLVDPDTLRVLDANDRACNLLGEVDEDVVGTLLIEHFAHEERDRIELYFKSGRGEPGVRIVPRTLCRSHYGERFPVQIAAVNIHIDGQPRKLAVLRDLSDTESAQETLLSMRRAVEATDEAIMILDEARRIVFANDASEALLGRPMDDLHGQDPVFLAAQGWADEWERAVNMTAAGWLWRGVMSFARPKGPACEIDVELVPVASPLGLVTHIVAVMRPLNSAPVDDEARWRKSSSSTLMLALLSRYVENALSSSRNRLGILATSGQVGDEMRTEVLAATFQIDCAIEFTRFMRDLHGRDRQSDASVEPESVGDLVPILKEVVETVRPLSDVHQANAEGEAWLATAPVHDPSMVREVLLNLLCNATAGNGPTGRPAEVALRSTVLDGKQAFLVRMSTSASPSCLRGSGGADPLDLGLTICRELVERVGGMLTVEERVRGDPLSGTIFGVVFPAA